METMARMVVVTVYGFFMLAALLGALLCAQAWSGCAPDVRWILAVFGAVCMVQVAGFAVAIHQEVNR